MKDNKKLFKPIGPFEIDFENMPGGKRISKENVANFWNGPERQIFKDEKGIYILLMKVGKGVLPCYVGKTNKTFEKECFTDHKLNIYNGEIIRYKRKNKPCMFFLTYKQMAGKKISDKVIRELEKFIINLAADKNPQLANIQGLPNEERFFIANLGGGRGAGAPTREGKYFKKLMGL